MRRRRTMRSRRAWTGIRVEITLADVMADLVSGRVR